MEAIVLAGGFGTRLRQVVANVPKPMAPVAGRPFLEIVLHRLAMQGFTRVVLSLGYMADLIQTHFGPTHQGMELVYEIEETPLGTGGAIRQSMERCLSDHVYVFNGDTYLELEVGKLEAFWQCHQQLIIVAREVPDTARYGRLDTREGRVFRFCEKGESGPGLINAGCYVLPQGILNEFPKGKAFSFETDFLSPAVVTRPLQVYVTTGGFIDIGVPEDYQRAQTELRDIVASKGIF